MLNLPFAAQGVPKHDTFEIAYVQLKKSVFIYIKSYYNRNDIKISDSGLFVQFRRQAYCRGFEIFIKTWYTVKSNVNVRGRYLAQRRTCSDAHC